MIMKKNLLYVILFQFLFLQFIDVSALTFPPDLNKVQVTTITVLGKYKGRQHDGNGGLTIRCNNKPNFICYTVTDDNGDLIINLGNGEVLRSTILPPVSDGSDIHPTTNEQIHTYYYNFGSPIEIYDPISGNWNTLPTQNLWTID